jgi:hypothetical protein
MVRYGKKERLLSNVQARARSLEELSQILISYFGKVHGYTSTAQEQGLREAAAWIKEDTITWTQAQTAIDDNTWEPAEGARAIFGPG